MRQAPSIDAYGEGGRPEIGIGNKDSVLTIIDVVSTVEDGPEGEEQDVLRGPLIGQHRGAYTGWKSAGRRSIPCRAR